MSLNNLYKGRKLFLDFNNTVYGIVHFGLYVLYIGVIHTYNRTVNFKIKLDEIHEMGLNKHNPSAYKILMICIWSCAVTDNLQS